MRVVEPTWKHTLRVAAVSFAEAPAGYPNKKMERVWGGDNGKREKAPRALSISVSQALPTITKESEVAVNTWCLTRKMLRILEFLVNIMFTR